ncbi:transcriptional regulator, TetR family [Cyclonatronum proteinivorum]|uniref:Transcriptional regulator, TetR family n=1 Tax=Cyclonatronum proteinivorum TaxID=1457365 RepID=A0A345UME4_9BACT|nr:TetR/AcrR family transcriptional regulator [Cyclonatronum proteinivorum]AXJ01646.1 transcriptional regulator, TetR family [Cyclonatronum proteinivorum]
MKRESEEKGNSLRKNILKVSRSMLLQEGFDRMSMRKIAASVGFSATSIYLYFKNKDDLLHALIEEGFDLLHEALSSNAVVQANNNPFEVLEALCREFVKFGMENPEYYEIMFQLHPKHMQRYPVDKYRKARRNIDLIRNTLELGQAQGLIKPHDSRLVANVILSTLHGGISLMNSGRIDAKVDKQAYVETIIHSVLAGVKLK